ncbi:MAG TPA: hypothetical protein VNT01_07005 [Symbiobacteriaceae bacterium]|nr:hypothetical protein [Symbiobacteriaceae bacterium]
MSPEIARAATRIAAFPTLLSALLLFALEPGTAEFAISSFTLVLGLLFIGAIALLVRRSAS